MLVGDRPTDGYALCILEVVAIHRTTRAPRGARFHHNGDGAFTLDGKKSSACVSE